MKGLKITAVEEGSTASEIGIEPGDEILRINASEVQDALAYRYLICAEEVSLLVKKAHGGLVEIELEKDEDDDLGIGLPDMRVRACDNKCVFCFVSQMPKGMRKSLYVKDEDYRHSFLYGNYITLTTLKDEDYKRIIEHRLSPLYVSVHTSDDALRRFLLGNPKAPSIMEGVRRLTDGGITLHTQAVVSQGLNDGEKLARTVEDLAALYPMVESLAVVPVGITDHREGLYPLKPFTKPGAARLLDLLDPYRKRFRKEFGVGFVYPSDELYIRAGREFPKERGYDGYPQIDNGVGLVRDFMTEFKKKAKVPSFSLRKEKVAKRNGVKKIVLVTGVSFGPYLKDAAKKLEDITGINIKVITVKNNLFGHGVTVAGLLSGHDIAAALKGVKADVALIPSVAMRDAVEVFLDDMTPDDVERESGVKVAMVPPTAAGLVDALKGLART